MKTTQHACLHAMRIAVIAAALLTVCGPKDDAAAQETKKETQTVRQREDRWPSRAGLCYKNPQGFVPLRKAQRYLQRPRPRADYLVPLQLVPVADGHHVQRARAVST